MNEDDQKSSSDNNKTEITSLVNMDKRKDSSGYGSVSEAVPSSGGGADDDGKKKASEEKTPKKSPEITQSKPGKSKPNPGFVNLYFDPGTEKCRDDDDDDANKTQENVKNQNQTDKPGTSQPGKLSVKDDPDKLSVSDVSRDFCPSPSPLDTLPLLLDDSLTESSMRVIGEIIVPFLLAGLGCVFAGVVLDLVKSWAVFQEMSEVFILVPALLGLKGNLEMTLASRLSTQANLGNMDSRSEQWKMIYGNLALTQVQAIVVGLLASLFAIALGWIPSGKFNIMHGFLMCAGSVLTAVLATLLLGSLMVGVVLFSRRFHINPDNVATPIAASLGDLTTISLLAVICQALFGSLDTQKWLTPTLLGMTMLLIPLWWVVSHKNKYTHDVLYTGWVPVIGAMFISSLGGLVLDYAVANYNGLAIFQPVINGVGGNLVAVQASRLSTALHKVSSPGTLPENAPHGVPNPVSTFFSSSSSSRTARVLMMMVVPGHIIFMLVIYFMQQTGDFVFTIPFAAIYLVAAVIQVGLLLYIANGLVHCLWARGNDPDNSSIPYLTAIGDLLGTSLLALTFLIISKLEPTVKH